MSKNIHDFVLDDDYVTEVGEYLSEQGKLLSEALNTYVTVMQEVIHNGIKKGKTTESLKVFLDEVNRDNGYCSFPPEINGSAAKRYGCRLIQCVDKEDKDLY